MLTVIMILLGIAVLLLLDGILENYFPIAKEYHIQSKKSKKIKQHSCLRICMPAAEGAKKINMCR